MEQSGPVLDAPGNNADSNNRYTCQVCVSWPHRPGFLGCCEPLDTPPSQAERRKLIEKLSLTWADPFRSFLGNVSSDAEIKSLDVADFPPSRGLHSQGRAVLMGDALHAMAMCMCHLHHVKQFRPCELINHPDRGEGANHAIADVLDFAKLVVPALHDEVSPDNFRIALDQYEDAVIDRTRPAVLLSRRACLDAHEWSRVNGCSPLLTRREMFARFDEENAD